MKTFVYLPFVLADCFILLTTALAQSPASSVSPSPMASPIPTATPIASVAPVASVTTELVRVEVTESSYATNVNDPIRLPIRIFNQIPGSTVKITAIDLDLPGAVVGTREATPCDVRNSWLTRTYPDDDPPEISEKSSNLLLYDIPPAKRFGWLWIVPRRPWLTFMPGIYEGNVYVHWSDGSDEQSGIASTKVKLKLDPDPLSLVIGGAVGSLLLVAFLFCFQLARTVATMEWPRTQQGVLDRPAARAVVRERLSIEFSEGVTRFLSGTLTAWILLLFLNYAKDIQIPVTIAVNDFFGAVLLGLFAHSLGKWVYAKLRPEAAKDDKDDARLPP